MCPFHAIAVTNGLIKSGWDTRLSLPPEMLKHACHYLFF